jgi:hypothetical protein
MTLASGRIAHTCLKNGARRLAAAQRYRPCGVAPLAPLAPPSQQLPAPRPLLRRALTTSRSAGAPSWITMAATVEAEAVTAADNPLLQARPVDAGSMRPLSARLIAHLHLVHHTQPRNEPCHSPLLPASR